LGTFAKTKVRLDKRVQQISSFFAKDIDKIAPSSLKKQKSVWASLIQKIFAVNPLICSNCTSETTTKSFIFDKDSLERINAWIRQKNKLFGQTSKPLPMKNLISAAILF